MPQAGRACRLWAAMRPKRACIKRLRLSEGNTPKAVSYLDKIKIRYCKADIAIAGGKKEGLLIKKGEIIEKIPQDKIVARFKEEI